MATLNALLAAWRKRPVPELAEAISALEPLGPLFTDERSFGDRVRRVNRLAKERDPRLVEQLLDYVRDMPFTSNSSRGMWGTIFRVLDEQDDPRTPARLKEAQSGWTIRPLQRAYLDGEVEQLLRGYAERWPDGPPKATAADQKLVAQIAKAAPQKKDGSAEALLAGVYASPDDDAPRSVYADWLSERNDPRGEFIALQLAPSPTPAQRKRMKELVKKHERAWIGPLEPVVARDGVEFRRGFLSACRVKLKNEMDVRRHGSDPSWATVEKLRFTGSRFTYQPFSSQNSGAFHVGPEMKSLRDVNVAHAEDVDQLLAAKAPWKIERLASCLELPLGKKALDALAKTNRLPRLVAIEIAAPHGWFARVRWTLKEIVVAGTDPERWVRELGKRPDLERLEVVGTRFETDPTRHVFTRDAKGMLVPAH